MCECLPSFLKKFACGKGIVPTGHPQLASWPHATAHSTPHNPPVGWGENPKGENVKTCGLRSRDFNRGKTPMHISKAK